MNNDDGRLSAALDNVLALAEIATPGEWRWVHRSDRLEIAAPHGGGTTVMDFVRKGMNGAQPRFGISLDGQPRGKRGGIMVTATELMESDADNQLRHPDAELLIAAVNLLRQHGPALADLARRWEGAPVIEWHGVAAAHFKGKLVRIMLEPEGRIVPDMGEGE